MSTQNNKAIVQEFQELADGGGDLDRLDTLCAANLVNHALAAGRPQGIAGTRQFLEQARRSTHTARWLSSLMVA